MPNRRQQRYLEDACHRVEKTLLDEVEDEGENEINLEMDGRDFILVFKGGTRVKVSVLLWVYGDIQEILRCH